MIEAGSVWERLTDIGGVAAGGLVIVCEVKSKEIIYRFIDDIKDHHCEYSRGLENFQANFKEVL